MGKISENKIYICKFLKREILYSDENKKCDKYITTEVVIVNSSDKLTRL